MTDLCRLIFWTLVDLIRSRATLEAEIWVLRQQINVLRRAAPRRQSFGIFDRLIFVGLYRLFPKACDALAIVKPCSRFRICCDVDPDQVSAVEPDDDEGIEQVETDSWNEVLQLDHSTAAS